MKPRTLPELIVALDVPAFDAVRGIIAALPDAARHFKIGLELFTAEGPEAVRRLAGENKKIFLDLKLHDIPNTVGHAVAAAARLGVSMLTLHAAGGRAMLKAAAEAARQSGACAPKLIAVTTLTSLNRGDLEELGIRRDVGDQALALGALALECGLDGLVASVQEIPALREKFGAGPILVAPGIRPAGSEVGDQKRTATPAMAVKAGADFLVVGRPILAAPDPRAAAEAILREMRT